MGWKGLGRGRWSVNLKRGLEVKDSISSHLSQFVSESEVVVTSQCFCGVRLC